MALSQRAPARRRFKRVLIVRQLAAQTTWLIAPPRWHEGRARWPFAFGPQTRWLSPGPAELADAERSLNKIENYPHALELAFGDENSTGAVWLQQRRAQLETVKVLARLEAPDLTSLARLSHAKNPATLQRLLELLIAEAFCRNTLPVSPAQILGRRPDDISASLIELCNNFHLPLEVRTLGAMILGARHENLNSLSDKPLRAAWQWSAHSGLSETPGTIARLLLEDDGAEWATRFIKLLPLTQKLNFDLDFWSELSTCRPAKAVIDMMQAVVACESVEWLHLRQKVTPPLQAALDQLQEKQGKTQVKFFRLLQTFTHEGDAATIHSLRDFVETLFEIETPLTLWAAPSTQWQLQRGNPLLWPLIHQQVSRHILFVLREVQNLSPEKRGAAFRLLKENAAVIWNADSLQDFPCKHDISRQAKSWLTARWKKRGWQILQLISHVDESTARRALDLKILHRLRFRQWRDPALAAWAFDLAASFATESVGAAEHLPNLFDLLGDYADLATARAELGSLFEAVRGCAATTRGLVARSIVMHLGCIDKSQRKANRIRFYVPVIARLAHDNDPWDLACFADAVLLLDNEMRRAARENIVSKASDAEEELTIDFAETLPETAHWLHWMADDILRTKPQKEDETDPVIYADLEMAALLAWTLSDGDFSRFQKLFTVAVRRDFNYDDKEQLKRALRNLQNYPAARPALGYLYASQPARLETLLKRWGLTLRLGDVQKPLEVFREVPTSLPLTWRELLQIAPDVWPTAAQLAHALLLLGRVEALPPGLQRVLDMPRKMETEYFHLAARQAQTPRQDWAARLAMLERRLQNRPELTRVMAEELQEKLSDMAAHTLLEAIEKQVSACYRARLQEVAGPLPAALVLDDDWLNAVLLTADIHSNRKLLRHLLRALLNGDSAWHQTHPGNIKFLQELAARGVDTKVWQSIMPRRFATSQGMFHLRLETQPLAILQMGNYFDTCLSFGGVNSFSTVANACELNKRVIFARDEKNRVVGRKLIGLNEDGKLIGFYTYTSLKDAAANGELRRCFAHYCENFARKCGLEMAQEGTIPRLFAEAWYDDGVVNWLDEGEKPLKGSKRKETSNSHATTARLLAKCSR